MLPLYHRRNAGILGLNPRTRLTQYLWLLPAPFTPPPTLTLSPRGWASPPSPSLIPVTQPFWLHQSLGLGPGHLLVGSSFLDVPPLSPSFMVQFSVPAMFSLDSAFSPTATIKIFPHFRIAQVLPFFIFSFTSKDIKSRKIKRKMQTLFSKCIDSIENHCRVSFK